MNRSLWSTVAVIAGMSLAWGAAHVEASTLAYWRFEEGPDGQQIQVQSDPAFGFGAGGANWSADVPDSSGSGNPLGIWDEGGAGFRYRNLVSGPVTVNGQANNFSAKNTGGGPAAWSQTGGALSLAEPLAWTVEASIKLENGGWRTFVGRDARDVVTGDGPLAAFYFQSTPESALRVAFTDKNGFFHAVQSANGYLQRFNFPTDNDGALVPWYNVAAVSDGSTLSLYSDDTSAGLGYQLLGSLDLTASGSMDTRMTNGSTGTSGSDWSPGSFTVGRGLYNGGHADRGYGFIDEVRISDVALAPSQFVFAAPVPEPSSIALLACFGAACAAGARRRCVKREE